MLFPNVKILECRRERLHNQFIARSEVFVEAADAWNVIVSLLKSGAIKPIVAKTFPLAEAAAALRYLVEGRPFGRIVLTI